MLLRKLVGKARSGSLKVSEFPVDKSVKSVTPAPSERYFKKTFRGGRICPLEKPESLLWPKENPGKFQGFRVTACVFVYGYL
jgi:hypothetical protein